MKELWLRIKEPLNTFWRLALIIFGAIGSVAMIATEAILPLLLNPEVSQELKDFLRPFYGWCLGVASAATATVKHYEEFKAKKHKQEFADIEKKIMNQNNETSGKF